MRNNEWRQHLFASLSEISCCNTGAIPQQHCYAAINQGKRECFDEHVVPALWSNTSADIVIWLLRTSVIGPSGKWLKPFPSSSWSQMTNACPCITFIWRLPSLYPITGRSSVDGRKMQGILWLFPNGGAIFGCLQMFCNKWPVYLTFQPNPSWFFFLLLWFYCMGFGDYC